MYHSHIPASQWMNQPNQTHWSWVQVGVRHSLIGSLRCNNTHRQSSDKTCPRAFIP
jgi:hypothetical protein